MTRARYTVTASTALVGESVSDVRAAFLRTLEVNGALPDPITITVRLETLAPSIGENHPAALAFHALNNAAQVVRIDPELVTDLDLGAASDLIAQGTHHLAELYHLFIRQERTIEEQKVSLVRERQYSTRVERKNSELVQSVITLTRQADDAHAVLVAQTETVQ